MNIVNIRNFLKCKTFAEGLKSLPLSCNMDPFIINILGCGSALPTRNHGLSGQVLSFRNKLFLIDCGEGVQLQMRRMKLNFGRISRIFITHLHGDHCFGLPGLISTLGMLGRTALLIIHAPAEAESIFRPFLDFFGKELPYQVLFEPVPTTTHEKIYEDLSIEVYSIPLHHRISTAGFLFKEKQKEANILREMIDFYQIPIREIPKIKQGADFITPDGEIVPNCRLVKPAPLPRSYAYCSDTAYTEKIVPFIEGIDLLYHESTFLDEDVARAKLTFHSTAQQAALIAQKAGVKQLILGHFSARYRQNSLFTEEAQEVFPATILSEDGMVIELPEKRL